ncbi:MAG: PAC2 family protein [Candidatus Bathyarchaeia archaeon]
METFVRERISILLRNPVLVEGFPGLGYVGKIAVTYLARQLGAMRLAELYSPYFPFHVITNRGGGIRLPRAQFYYYLDRERPFDLVFCTSDSQAQSLEGQFDVVDKILAYARNLGAQTIVAIGGYSGACEEERPICVATSKELLKKMLDCGAVLGPLGNPIVGLAGVTLGMAKLARMDAACILGRTVGHLPDPDSAKNVLEVLQRFLGVSINMEPLDKEIERANRIFKNMENVQKEMEKATKDEFEPGSGKITYIS